MIVVDTSVWIDVINANETPKATRCIELLESGAPIALTDIIFTEILQGLRTDEEAEHVEGYLRAFPMLKLNAPDDLALAASLYRQARRAGVTIRKSLDCLIAAPCVRAGVPILHSDRDFQLLASCTSLKIFE